MRNWMTAVSITISMIGLSVLLHSPFTNPSLYTDILGFFWNDFASRDRMPYLQLDQTGSHFEYPFLSGLLSILAWKAGGDLAGFYAVYSGMVATSALAMAYAMMRLYGNNGFWMYLVSPSLVVYGVYGYDVFLAALTALAVFFFTRERYSLSAILLALAFHTKLFSILFLPYALLRLDGRQRLKYLTVFGLVVGAPIIAMPEAFKAVVEAQTGWSLENAWYVHVFPDAASPVGPNTAPGLSTAILFGLIGMAMLYLYVLRKALSPAQFMLLATASYLMFTPRYSPQTNIFLLPFLPASGILMFGFPLWELSNAAIILTWFTTSEPFKPWSIPQTMALVRFIALSTIFVQSLHAAGLLKKPSYMIPYLPRIVSVLRRLGRV
ncbi:MAG: glycosyltransferase family 87 protein [Candidatus Caldarchaeum sp.]